MIGQTISNFQIIKELGAGGMGTVYKAKDTRLQRNVAIKMLHPHVTSNSDAYRRFQNEAMVSAQINHPNVATLYDFIEHQGRSLLVMEYVEGETLEDLLKQEGKLSESKCIDLVIKMLKGLSAAHQLDILHRDLKPSNIMLDKKGFIKIMDFGIARISNATRITAHNRVIGTAEYIAPEIYLGKAPTKVSDLYSIGIILYELLSGQVLFKADSEASLIYQVVNEKPKFKLDHVSSGLKSIIKKLISKNPKNRYRTTNEVIDKLENLKNSAANKPLDIAGTFSNAINSLRPKFNNFNFQFPKTQQLNTPIKFLLASLFLSVIIIGLGSAMMNSKSDDKGLVKEEQKRSKSQDPQTNFESIYASNNTPNKPSPYSIEKDEESSLEITPINKKSEKKSDPEAKKQAQPPSKKKVKAEQAKVVKSQVNPKPQPVTIEQNISTQIEEPKTTETPDKKARDKTEFQPVKIEEKPQVKEAVREKLQPKKIRVQEQNMKVTFGQEISSSRLEKGETIYLKAGQNIYSEGELLIEKHAPIKAVVSKLKRKNNGKVHFGIQILQVKTKFDDWLDLDYPEYSDIKKGDFSFGASTSLSKVKIRTQRTTIFY